MGPDGAAGEPGSLLLIQFAREPVAGEVKTRMMPELSALQACDLHCELVRWTCGQLVDSGIGPVELAVAGDPGHPLFSALPGLAGIARQRGGDLGERMYRALADGLRRYRKVLLVGSDCPFIDGDYLAAAEAALDARSLVLGPAEDGGYVLVGAACTGTGRTGTGTVCREMFENISWGSDSVCAQTRERLRQLDHQWAELPVLADIDRPADLPRWRALQARRCR